MFLRDVSELELLEGPVQFAHQYVNMTQVSVEIVDPDTGAPQTVVNRSHHIAILINYSSKNNLGTIVQTCAGIQFCIWRLGWRRIFRFYSGGHVRKCVLEFDCFKYRATY